MSVVSMLLIAITILFLIGNLYYFFTSKSYKQSYFCPTLFYKLFFVLVGITFGFAFLYYFLSFHEPVLLINDPTGEIAEQTFLDFLYFSGVTMLSIGYGDLVPVGSARFFSIIQASLGLLLPAAYFMKGFSVAAQSEETS
ncbi:Ion transport 2 domain protein [Alkalihalophilus pseudofirmus OF4]|uniref:Ion transport 2 domain protein n=1 Tax=Alkalihalophilus pseudofirmus (strain ATCC BAA-2126 / JCM 17055 / OF4) TaxID=398511 RepID=D3FQ73_ALKPO|nr:potassium channel family protein [Alkalihalophilus pseudofirmus]ADC49545.1 Ion transport 2 domain protein [Alkalihalophilus pseudofirmus OF4]